MSDHIQSLVVRVEGAAAADRLQGRTDGKNLKAVLWEIDAEGWERGVMWKGGIGTIPPERPPNPYLQPPQLLPTRRSLILAEVDDRYTEDKVLLTGPHTDKGNTWWMFDNGVSLIPDEINSFEVLWTEGDR